MRLPRFLSWRCEWRPNIAVLVPAGVVALGVGVGSMAAVDAALAHRASDVCARQARHWVGSGRPGAAGLTVYDDLVDCTSSDGPPVTVSRSHEG